MFDRSVQFPNRYRMTPVPGTSDIVDLIPAPGEIEHEGTPINKATLLTDDVALLLGLNPSQDPTVNDALLASSGFFYPMSAGGKSGVKSTQFTFNSIQMTTYKHPFLGVDNPLFGVSPNGLFSVTVPALTRSKHSLYLMGIRPAGFPGVYQSSASITTSNANFVPYGMVVVDDGLVIGFQHASLPPEFWYVPISLNTKGDGYLLGTPTILAVPNLVATSTFSPLVVQHSGTSGLAIYFCVTGATTYNVYKLNTQTLAVSLVESLATGPANRYLCVCNTSFGCVYSTGGLTSTTQTTNYGTVKKLTLREGMADLIETLYTARTGSNSGQDYRVPDSVTYDEILDQCWITARNPNGGATYLSNLTAGTTASLSVTNLNILACTRTAAAQNSILFFMYTASSNMDGTGGLTGATPILVPPDTGNLQPSTISTYGALGIGAFFSTQFQAKNPDAVYIDQFYRQTGIYDLRHYCKIGVTINA